MRPGKALPELVALARTSRDAARAYGGSRAGAARRARRARREGAWTYAEAFANGVLDPALGSDERSRMYSTHRRETIQNRLNPPRLASFSEDKLAFARYMDALSVPSPAVYGTVGRAGGWSATDGRPLRGAGDFARMLLGETPHEVVIKPVMGCQGDGVHLLRREPGGLRDHRGGPVDPGELHARLVADPEYELFIVQERLRNHPGLEEINPSPALQTLRLVTLVTLDGATRLLFGSVKFVLGGAATDNVRGGRTGNGDAAVDLETGTVGPVMLARPDGAGCTAHDAIATTGRRVAGRILPFFAEAREMVLRAAPHLLPMRTLGWDVALTPRGPVVLEANDFWGLPPRPLDPEAHALFVGA